MSFLRRLALTGAPALILTVAIAGCGNGAASLSPTASSSSASPDLSAIACATSDPTDVGDLTGAWEGDDGGVYYIRQVGDCVWWFGTDVTEMNPAGQRGFANVASGRIEGTRIDVEYVDLPLGNVLGGGGLTLVYDEETGELTIAEQRGEWMPFGASRLTRTEAESSPTASPGW
jgi:hypothetical protein